MGYFKDLREHLAALEEAGLLVKIDELINKDTELMPLVVAISRSVGGGAPGFHVYECNGCQGTESTTFPSSSGLWLLRGNLRLRAAV